MTSEIIPVVHAEEPAPHTGGSYWLIANSHPSHAPYKNDVLMRYQDEMSMCGLPREEQRVFVQQVIQENGALDPKLAGGTDRGCSYGIGQWWVCDEGYTSKSYLTKFPERATYEYQIPTLAKDACGRYEAYNENLYLAVVAHNCPRCAGPASKRKLGDNDRAQTYWKAVTKHSEIVAVE